MVSEADRTRLELATEFAALGLTAGDSVIVHSSYRAVRPVEGGPETVIDALLDVLGRGGNLMLPTFNYTRPIPEPYYDPAATPCRTGIIPELGRRRPGAVRSLHPTHSFAAIGPDAVELTSGHLDGRAFGPGCPLDKLCERGGKVLLLGVGHISNSTVHLGEEYALVPKKLWIDPYPPVKIKLPDGSLIEHEIDTSPSCSAAFGAAEYPLRRGGLIRDRRLGGCMMQLMRAEDVVDCVQAMITERSDVLLCTWPGCVPCCGARDQLREQGRLRVR